MLTAPRRPSNRPTKFLEKALRLRLSLHLAELAEIHASPRPDGIKARMAACVDESVASVERQLAELSRRAERGCFVGTVAS